MFKLKKSLLIIISVVLVLSFIFTACSAKNKKADKKVENTTATENNLENKDTEFGFETEEVTDKDGKSVTDKDGNKVTTEVAVVYKKDSKGNDYAQKLDANGKGATKKNGSEVTVKSTTKKEPNNTTAKSSDNQEDKETTKKSNATSTTAPSQTIPDKTTATTKAGVELTDKKETTEFDDNEEVPKTDATGKEVSFSKADQEIIASMLEVPYLYKASYENSEGIPISTAVYTAVWMQQREGATATGSKSPYASNPVILNLFKFYANTVVNFKTKCNDIENTPITYKSDKQQFFISSFPDKKQSVVITKIEDVGNNNFYKITGNVTNAEKITKVVAIIQKNRLEPTLGFSIKALKWS